MITIVTSVNAVSCNDVHGQQRELLHRIQSVDPHLIRGSLFSQRGHSSVHSLQPLVQFISLAEVEPDGLFLSLALQTVADTLLEQSTAGALF